ncbi:MAG: hypothetical protein ACUVXB_15965 [Bryobacteraceae bacterium]
MKPSRRSFLLGAAAAPGLALRNNNEDGCFWRQWWYEPGIEHGNPGFNSRFRVNSPEASLHPEFGSRSEVRSSGMLQILMPEDPRTLAAVELYCELWGGHPGTANKRVSINGRSTYPLPENGTAVGHCTHSYPRTSLRRDDVVNGYNAIQFACDNGTSFWGHFIVDNACLRAALPRSHADLKRMGLDRFQAEVRVEPAGNEVLNLHLETNMLDRIAAVHYQGYYDGYDENGSGLTLDWHGFTKERQPEAWLGTALAAPFTAPWDTSMTPGITASVRATVHFHDAPGIVFETTVRGGIRLPRREGVTVACYPPSKLPVPFWSRAGRPQQAVIEVPAGVGTLERAQLHVVVWDGGRGSVKHPFRLNGQPVEVCGAGKHDVIYSVRDLHPRLIEKTNVAELLSDTDHHGIEVLLPGPALMLRFQS